MVAVLTIPDILTFLAIVIAFIISKRIVERIIRRRNYRLPPGPKGLPLVGYVGSLDYLRLWDHKEKYGDVSYVSILGRDVVILNSLDAITDGLRGEETAGMFSARPNSFSHQYMIKHDVALSSPDDENWKPLRKMFHSLLKQYGEGIDELRTVVCNELDTVIEKLDETIDRDVDIGEYFKPSLLNILTVLAIGERYDYDDWRVQSMMESIGTSNSLVKPSVDIILQTFPFLRFVPIGPGSRVARFQRLRERNQGFLHRGFKNLPSDVLDSRKGIVFEMMRTQRTQEWLSDSNIEGILSDMYGAGYLTTDASLRAFFLLMLHYPDVQRKIQDDIDRVVGAERRPEISDRASMPYTIAAILELTRYTSIAPLSIPHACTADTDFRGYTVPRGSTIILNLFRVLHDDDLWNNPWEFDPERFLDASGSLLPATDVSRQRLIPFGVGKRVCLGEVFAKTRLFLYITHLLQVFTFRPSSRLPSCDPRGFGPGLVLNPNPYKIRIERRN